MFDRVNAITILHSLVSPIPNLRRCGNGTASVRPTTHATSQAKPAVPRDDANIESSAKIHHLTVRSTPAPYRPKLHSASFDREQQHIDHRRGRGKTTLDLQILFPPKRRERRKTRKSGRASIRQFGGGFLPYTHTTRDLLLYDARSEQFS
ncbi:hypothetical protein Trydic_g20611 [Trypoxylus dichotomus]